MYEVLAPITKTFLWTSVLLKCLLQPMAGSEELVTIPSPFTLPFWVEILLRVFFSVAIFMEVWIHVVLFNHFDILGEKLY